MWAAVAYLAQSWEKSVYPMPEDVSKFLFCQVLYDPYINLESKLGSNAASASSLLDI